MTFDYDSVRSGKYQTFCDCDTSDCHCDDNNGVQMVQEWTWDTEHITPTVILSEQNLDVKFHDGYSSGTAAARGNRLLEKGRHHYWEVKMTMGIYGTDVMVGVGTSKEDFRNTKFTYSSLLGRDQESFGFSYRGYIQHGGEKRTYGSCFGRGSLVGIHLDTWKGTLEFFLNRRPLGIAFTGLRDADLYPMVCSTAAHSKMRLTYSYSVPVSLQTECLATLKPVQKEYLCFAFPGLRYLSQSFFPEILAKHIDDDEDEDKDLEFSADYLALDEFDLALVGFRRKVRKTTNDDVSVVETRQNE